MSLVKCHTPLDVTSYHSHSSHSMSIGPPIPEIQHFQNLTLKIQDQGHGWRGHWKSQHGSNILLTHIPLIPCQSAIPFLRYDFFKIWPWKSKVKVMGEGNVESHKEGVTSYQSHIPFIPCQSALPFLRFSIFKIWPWKSKVKVKWPWCCTTTGLDNFIELQMV